MIHTFRSLETTQCCPLSRDNTSYLTLDDMEGLILFRLHASRTVNNNWQVSAWEPACLVFRPCRASGFHFNVGGDGISKKAISTGSFNNI